MRDRTARPDDVPSTTWSASASSFVTSPRHADVLLVTGPLTRNLVEALEQARTATPDPKFVVAVGDCAVDGGVFKGSYAVAGGVGNDPARGSADQRLPADARAHSGGTARAARGERAQRGGDQLAVDFGAWCDVWCDALCTDEWCGLALVRGGRMMRMRLVVHRVRRGGRDGRGGEGCDRQNEAEQGEQVSARGGHGIGSEDGRGCGERLNSRVEKASLID